MQFAGVKVKCVLMYDNNNACLHSTNGHSMPFDWNGVVTNVHTHMGEITPTRSLYPALQAITHIQAKNAKLSSLVSFSCSKCSEQYYYCFESSYDRTSSGGTTLNFHSLKINVYITMLHVRAAHIFLLKYVYRRRGSIQMMAGGLKFNFLLNFST